MSQYDEMIRNMPAGLDRAILRVLDFHHGKVTAIGGDDLTRQVQSSGFGSVDQRTVKEQIKELRRQGHLICSAPGREGGYYLATDANELEEFLHVEFEAKISDMAETARAMRKAADERFGQGIQGRLF